MTNKLEIIKNSSLPYIIGVDECGTGSCAGGAYVCALKAPKDWFHSGIDDSKQLTPKKREKLSKELHSNKDITFSIVFYEANKIDSFHEEGKNLTDVLKDLYSKAIRNLDYKNSLIVIDGIHKLDDIEHISLPKADSLVPSVMAASIIGKVARDQRMVELSKFYPDYGFDKSKGYLTAAHIKALEKFGPCAIHRFCYEPIKSMIKK